MRHGIQCYIFAIVIKTGYHFTTKNFTRHAVIIVYNNIITETAQLCLFTIFLSCK